ncbi:MAG: hypothetical protein RLY61_310 [Candidatus Parcubacteria bacterium]|jgi:ribulose kinase
MSNTKQIIQAYKTNGCTFEKVANSGSTGDNRFLMEAYHGLLREVARAKLRKDDRMVSMLMEEVMRLEQLMNHKMHSAITY